MGTTTILAEAILTDEQLKAVGCLALESNHLEIYIDGIIGHYCGENVGKLLLERKMLDAKVGIFKTLFYPLLTTDGLRKRLDSLHERIKSDIPKRNAAIHGDWGLGRSIPLSEIFNRKNVNDTDAVYKTLTIKADEVMDIARRFANYQMELVSIWMEFQEIEQPSQDTSE